MKTYSTVYFNDRFHKTPWYGKVLDPGSEFVTKWNRIFLVTAILALFVDPLYFYLPIVGGEACVNIDLELGIIVTFFRSFTDLFHVMHILMKFRTAYIAPSSRVFGRGELVMDKKAIAMRYLKSDFVIDLAATLPIPQAVIWFIIPATNSHPLASDAKHTLALMVLIQYIPRFFIIFPLNRQIIKTTGVIAKTAWSGAAYNLLLYVLASHILGSVWYVLSIERQLTCWKDECNKERGGNGPPCDLMYLDCDSLDNPKRAEWLNSTEVLKHCDPDDPKIDFQFGMFGDAFTNNVPEATFIDKYFYCLSWGLRSLNSYGQNLEPSTLPGETLLSSFICITGLVLFAHLIGQMQNFLQSTTCRLEEWRVRSRDTEEWMRHRQLPPELQERIRRFVQYKWLATRGVDEESILRSLPEDLRRDVQRYLCLALVRRVPFFAQMDNLLLDAICERLVPSLSTKDSYIVREGDPVNEMLFIIRGQLESSTTDGGRSGFYNSIILRAGDFCGEELLTWALMPNSTLNLPASTRTVKSLTEVEAFALRADDLKFVSGQFKRMHSKKLQHAFRYYSHQWRTWGTCYIQTAWKKYKHRKQAEELSRHEDLYYSQNYDQNNDTNIGYYNEGNGSGGGSLESSPHLGVGPALLASRFAAEFRKARTRVVQPDKPEDTSMSMPMPRIFKPEEPDFSGD